MNKKQMTVIWIVLSILLVMSLFVVVRIGDNGYRTQLSFVLFYSYNPHYKVDLEATISSMLPVIILGAGLVLAFKDKKSCVTEIKTIASLKRFVGSNAPNFP